MAQIYYIYRDKNKIAGFIFITVLILYSLTHRYPWEIYKSTFRHPGNVLNIRTDCAF